MAAGVAVAVFPNPTFCQKSLNLSSSNNQFLGGLSRKFNFDVKSAGKRRDLVSLVVASASAGSAGAGRFYINITGFPFPLGPFLNRRTIRTEAVKDSIWLFEQEQALGFSSVSTNIRMTVIKLKSGGLWIHAPVAPTKECIQLLKELNAPVEYIVLPTFAYEHKIFVGPFSRKFPRAQVWVAPRQWSWPLNLPVEFFGIFRPKVLSDEDKSSPWADEIEQKVLTSPEVGIGPYVEVAFYHRLSRTLLVTDAVIFVPRQPPDCISKESLLKSAKNGLAVKILSKGKEVPDEPVVDNKVNRQKGLCMLGNRMGKNGPSNPVSWSFKSYGAHCKLFTNVTEVDCFSNCQDISIQQSSRKGAQSHAIRLEKPYVLTNPLEDIVLPPLECNGRYIANHYIMVRDWVDRIARDWPFKRIIPAHFAAPLNAGRSDFLVAFAFLDELLGERFIARPSLSRIVASIMGKAASYFPPDDMKTLSSLDEFLVSVGAVKKTVSGRKR